MSEHFYCPTVDDLDSSLSVQKTGREDASKGIPATEATTLTTFEQSIGSHLQSEVLAEERYSAQELLNKRAKDRAESPIGLSIEKMKLVTGNTEAKLVAVETENKPDLVANHRELLEAESSLKLFREENNLTKGAMYPESQIMHAVIIAAIVIGETIINGRFFGVNMAGGLEEGMIAALIITAVNVGLAYIVGTFCVSRINHINTGTKVAGWFFIAIYAMILTWFCLAVGHYRGYIHQNQELDDIEIDPAVKAAEQVMDIVFDFSRLFQVNDFTGWILVLLSMAVGILTTIKFYKADDPYPGYGDKDRKFKRCTKRLNDKQIFHSKQINDVVDNQLEEILGLKLKTEKDLIFYQVSLKQSDALIKEYKDFFKEVQIVYNGAIQLYRQGNRTVRPTSVPDYFDNDESFDAPNLENIDTLLYDEDLNKLPQLESAVKEDLPNIYEEARENVVVIQASLKGRFENYMKGVSRIAQNEFEAGAINV